MPLYDLSIVLRTVPRAELVECMKKVGGVLYDHGAIVRGLEFLGHRNLPQLRALDHIDRSSVVKDGNYFIVSVFIPL